MRRSVPISRVYFLTVFERSKVTLSKSRTEAYRSEKPRSVLRRSIRFRRNLRVIRIVDNHVIEPRPGLMLSSCLHVSVSRTAFCCPLCTHLPVDDISGVKCHRVRRMPVTHEMSIRVSARYR
jgi:hypothetical protein